jgi:hypothetical protein
MLFPAKWSLPKSIVEESQVVGFEAESQSFRGISFVTAINEVEVSKTLSRIAKIIKLNKEKELKERLFKDTVEQLKTTFEKTNLDYLKTGHFNKLLGGLNSPSTNQRFIHVPSGKNLNKLFL